MDEQQLKRHLRLGEFRWTPSAEQDVTASGQSPADFLERHIRGDWGQVSADEQLQNEEAISSGGRLRSIYKTLLGAEVWIITEADRSRTTLTSAEEG